MSFLLPPVGSPQRASGSQRPPPNPVPRVTVGVAPHLRGYTPRKHATPTTRTVGNRLRQAEGGINDRGTSLGAINEGHNSVASTSDLGSASFGSASVASARTPKALKVSINGQDAGVEVDGGLIGVVTAPQVTIALVNRKTARVPGESASARGKGEFIRFWPISDERSLVVTADSLDHWNAIAAVSRVEVLPQQRRFPFIFPSAKEDVLVSAYAQVFSVVVALAIGATIGVVLSVCFMVPGTLDPLIHTFGSGGFVAAVPGVGGLVAKACISANRSLRRQFQLGLEFVLKYLERMHDIESETNFDVSLGLSTSTAIVTAHSPKGLEL